MKTLTAKRRIAGAVSLGAAAAVALTGCAQTGPQSASTIDEVQGAVIQLEAHGTFVSPEGAFEGAGRGSGFIIDPSGIAVTNNHVVTGAGTLEVWIGGDTTKSVSAEILGVSECLDLAVVKLPGGPYPTLSWFEGEIKNGLEVYSAGFPLGDPNYTLTRGIVSKADVPQDTNWASVDHTIEHDARIRPGNSGGPLVDANGKVVGVNYAYENTVDYNGAIHRDEALRVIEQLKEGDVLSLGINGRGIFNADGVGLGIWVESVAAGGSADMAGIEPGDILTRMQGVSLGLDGTLKEYCDVLETQGDDAVLTVEVYRPSENAMYEGRLNADEEIQPRDQVAPTPPQPGDTVTVVDDTGSLSYLAPGTWTETDGRPATDDTGRSFAVLSAAPDLDGYNGSWTVPGVTAWATPDVSAQSLDAVFGIYDGIIADGQCVQSGGDAYEDDVQQGFYEIYSDCGGVGALTVLVAVTAKDSSYSALVALQALSEDDFAAIDLVLGSLTVQF